MSIPRNWVYAKYTKPDYPGKACDNPPGYRPSIGNPGDVKFYQYNYNAQTANGLPLRFPGRGWQEYYHTGHFPPGLR